MTETIDVGSVDILADVITKGRTLPEGYDHWAFRAVRPDLSSSHGYRWPFPGSVAEAPGPFGSHLGECPIEPGDGICAATTYAGMASGGVAARTLLLVAYCDADVLGGRRKGGKLRLSRCLVVELIDGERILRVRGRGANLRDANLRGAYLYGAIGYTP